MEDASKQTTESWIHRRVWLRWFRLFYGILFVWAAALGLSRRAWEWALWPFLAFAAFLIFRDWLLRIEPRIGKPLAIALAVSVLAHNLVATVWPDFARRSPLIAEGIVRRLVGTDVKISTQLDPCGAALQKLMSEYKFKSEDAEAASFKKELDALNAARQAGSFSPADELREKDLFQKYKQLIQRSAELNRMIQESGCAVEIPSQSTASSPPLTPVPKRDSEGPTARPMNKVNPAISSREESIRIDYDALMSRFSAVEASLRQRSQDLGGSPIKPEITTAIAECRADLAASLAALSEGQHSLAISRLDRVRRNLKYLESL
jgi:hypothetical protein